MKTTEITRSRRFYKDRWHPYGWEVGFQTTVTDGQKRVRLTLFDIGVDRWSAIHNALRPMEALFELKATPSLKPCAPTS